MNGEIRTDSMTPWRDRASFPAVSMPDVVLGLVALTVSALGVALYAYEQVSFFILIFLFVYTVRVMRSAGNTALLLVTALAASVLTVSLSGAAVVLSLAVGAGTLAWLLTLGKHSYLPPICLLLAAVAALLITKSPECAFLTLSFLPPAALMAGATVTHQRRTAVICFGIGGFLISLAVLLAVLLYRACGSLELGAIRAYLETLHGEAVNALVVVRDALLSYLESTLGAEGGYSAEEIAALAEELRAAASTPILQGIVTMLFSIAPALAVIACSVLAFDAQLLQGSTYLNTGWKQVLTRRASVFTMSIPAAILYDLSFFVTLFFGASTVLGAAMQNLCLMLLPGFCVIGWGALVGAIHRARGGARILWLLLIAVLICFAGAMSPFLLALWGTNAVIMAALQMRMLKRIGKTLGESEQRDEKSDHDDDDTE